MQISNQYSVNDLRIHLERDLALNLNAALRLLEAGHFFAMFAAISCSSHEAVCALHIAEIALANRSRNPVVRAKTRATVSVRYCVGYPGMNRKGGLDTRPERVWVCDSAVLEPVWHIVGLRNSLRLLRCVIDR